MESDEDDLADSKKLIFRKVPHNRQHQAQKKPEMLDRARTRITDLEGITTDELSALAKSYLGRDRVSRATVLPGK